jgi:transglutaminase-like putative cysteine protease
MGALLSAAVRLHSTSWTEHLSRMEFNVILGAVFGFALGVSMFRGRWTFLMGLVFSLFFVPWQLGLMMSNLEWHNRLSLLYARLWYATADFLANKPVRDSILFLTTMMVLYWFASLLSAYQLVRRANPWLPLLSLGGMILVIEYTMEMYRYARIVGATYSFIFLVFNLLLMGRIYYLRSRKEWEERGGTVEMEVGYDLGRGVAIAAVVLALVAWNTPRVVNFFDSDNPTRERVSRSWQVFRDRISKAVNTLRSPAPMVVEGYGSNMFLGTGGNLSEEVMFTIEPEFGRNASRFYWTARTYDNYRAGQWTTTIDDVQPIGPGQSSIQYPDWDLRRQMQLTFRSRISLLKTLYYAAEPLNINREAQAIVSVAEDGATDLNAIILEPPLKSGESYSIRASVVQPTILALREAGAEYPDWITERYLALPNNMSPRIVELARQIAGEEESPYDQAVAITQYLRRTITYSETVPEPPRGRDPIEWFLFDQRSGFCNYYASAEVLMLRSLGIPARLSVGYAEGTWDPETETYVVLGKDSHAWPEVFFPTVGWVPFEPTVSQPLQEFPAGERVDSEFQPAPLNVTAEPTFDPMSLIGQQDGPVDLSGLDLPGRSPLAFIKPWMVIFFVALVVVGVLSFLEWRRRRIQDLPLPSFLEKTLDEHGFRTPDWLRLWSRRALRTPMENLFAHVAMMLRVWGQRVEPALTPAEQVALLVNVVPGIRGQALVLLEEYQRAMYSQYPANLLRAHQAVTQLRSIGYRNWVMRLIGFET